MRGWDYTEISKALNIPWIYDGDGVDMDFEVRYLQSYMESLFRKGYNGDTRPIKWFVKITKEYLRALIYADHSGWTPLYEGMLNMTCNTSFLQATYRLIEHMWS